MAKRKKAKKEDEFVLRFDRRLILVFAIIVLLALIIYFVSSRPETANQGDVVLVNYVGSFENGTVFDTNVEKVALENNIQKNSYEPVEITISAGNFIKGFEDALYEMKEGETKTITVPPELAYGDYDPANIISVRNDYFVQQGVDPSKISIGMRISTTKGVFLVVDKTNESIFLDGNHPLVGRTLVFEIELLKIK